jgi:predicted CoA-binding protein
MTTIKEAANNFLSLTKIAVAGVSRKKEMAANLIYRKLRAEGYTVFAVNPNASAVEGDVCYPNLQAIPERPEGVVIVTKPAITDLIVKDCAALGITKVWMHKGMDSKTASISEEAVKFCRENGISAIPGGCPMMYVHHADFGHLCMRWIRNITGESAKPM